MSECKRIADYSRAVRTSTLKRLSRVPKGLQNFRLQMDGASFSEIAAHLHQCDLWLEEKIKDPEISAITGVSELKRDYNSGEFLMLVSELEKWGDLRSELITNIGDEKLLQTVHDDRFGEVTYWWIVVRGNLDHEVHHRGQLSAYLQML